MADWQKPTVASLYADFVTEGNARDTDAVSLCSTTPTNPPTGALQYDRALGKLKEYNGAIWVDKPIGITGGGTGAATAALARTALGLGSIATQDAGAIVITGGTLAAISALGLSGSVTFAVDDTGNLGTNAARPSRIYVRSALVIPVGTDKFTTT
jgi:hypothetical protein